MRNFILLSIVALTLIIVPAFAQTEPSSSPVISYELPYPGLLPDNPLYFFKVLRDKVQGFLISDPIKKAEFDILQADKRLNVGIYLFDEGKEKYTLSESTISKGENYFDGVIISLTLAEKEGIDISSTVNKLNMSLQKHDEVIKEMGKKTSGKLKEGFLDSSRKVTQYQNQAEEFGFK